MTGPAVTSSTKKQAPSRKEPSRSAPPSKAPPAAPPPRTAAPPPAPATAEPPPSPAPGPGPAPIAEELAKKQREISVSEFFERNKQLLGFDSPTRALLTSVKEAVDNALDACEESGILPELAIEIQDTGKRNEFRLSVEDNGPGIVKKQIGPIFGKLLYGSRFHVHRQSRGQQGLGISGAVMYAQLTTGRPARIRSKIAKDQPAYEIDLLIDTKHNQPQIVREEVQLWGEKEHGTRIEMTLVGRYVRAKQSPLEYLQETAIVNPHARISFVEPDGTKTLYDRTTERAPAKTTEIKPHPQGIELGQLLAAARATEAFRLSTFLSTEFSRVSMRAAREIAEAASLDEELRPQDLVIPQAQRLLAAFQSVKLMAPPVDCLSPIGESLIKKGLKANRKAEFFTSHTRPRPGVWSGQPFVVEAGIIYGGELPKEEQIQILRYANRCPLLFQQGSCAVTHAVEEINWKRYGLEQKGSKGIPVGPVVVMVHVASTKIPYTSEAKEAIADVPEILSEIELAIRACGKKLNAHIRKKARYAKLREKEDLIRKVLPLIAKKSADILGKPVPPIDGIIAKIMNSVLVTDTITYDVKARKHTVTHQLVNYTATRRRFTVLEVVPADAVLGKSAPKPRTEEGMLAWDATMAAQAVLDITYELSGLDKDDLEETEVYLKGIDPELVNGAEPWDEEGWKEKKAAAAEAAAEGGGAAEQDGGAGALAAEEAGEEELTDPDDERPAPKKGRGKKGAD